MKRLRFVLHAIAAVQFAAVGIALCWEGDGAKTLAPQAHSDGQFSLGLVSAPYKLDRIYLSMRGPRSNQPRIRLVDSAPADETIWLTGVDIGVVDAKSLAPISNEFFCHANLTLNPETTSPEKHNRSLTSPGHANWRFFTLVPGRTSIHLPAGFGVPIKNGTLLDNFTMTLNQNPGQPERLVRVKTNVWYRHEDKEKESLRPLFRRALYVYQQHAPLAGTASSHSSIGQHHQGELCGEACNADQKGLTPSTFLPISGQGLDAHPGASCCVENATPEGVMAQFGQENTVHWMVPPGKHRYRAEMTRQLDLPFDTTAHYVTGHLHPFGTSLKLVDLESGKTVFEIEAHSFSDRLGVESISEISSREGVPLVRGRRYELIADYDNTTLAPIDAMAIMYLYALDEPAASSSHTLGRVAR